jgi:carbon-monoxide dehydrogenase medium subunit
VKPAAFEYEAPTTLTETLAALADDDDTRILAGGQSLVPLMNLRLARPRRLVDINGVEELDYLEVRDSTLRLGALTRHRRLELDLEVADAAPLLTQAAALVGHPQIRNRATVGGTFAHADPVAELSAAVLALGGRVTVAGRQGRRTIDAASFFVGHFTTSLAQGEMVIEVEVPVRGPREGAAFREFAPRHGDFAVAGMAAVVALDESGACTRVSLAGCGLASTPVDLSDAGTGLVGEGDLTDTAVADVGDRVRQMVAPGGDIHGSGEYRRELAQVLAVDAVRAAWRQALEA